MSKGLILTVVISTRCTTVSQTLIDNIYCNAINCNYESYVIVNDLSDFYPILIKIKCLNVNKKRKN